MCYSSEHSIIMEMHYKVRELENQKQLSGSPPVIATTSLTVFHCAQLTCLEQVRKANFIHAKILFVHIYSQMIS